MMTSPSRMSEVFCLGGLTQHQDGSHLRVTYTHVVGRKKDFRMMLVVGPVPNFMVFYGILFQIMNALDF